MTTHTNLNPRYKEFSDEPLQEPRYYQKGHEDGGHGRGIAKEGVAKASMLSSKALEASRLTDARINLVSTAFLGISYAQHFGSNGVARYRWAERYRP